MEAIIASAVSALASIVAVLITAKGTQSKIMQEIGLQNAKQGLEISHIKNDLAEMKADIKEHNGYGKKFVEMQGEIKVIKEQIKQLEKEEK